MARNWTVGKKLIGGFGICVTLTLVVAGVGWRGLAKAVESIREIAEVRLPSVQAISQMEKVTQTTAASAEEGAAASEEMNSQAETLRGLVQVLQQMVGQ